MVHLPAATLFSIALFLFMPVAVMPVAVAATGAITPFNLFPGLCSTPQSVIDYSAQLRNVNLFQSTECCNFNTNIN